MEQRMYEQPETWEDMEGTSYPDKNSDDELVVKYQVHCWSESHPYGDSTSYERQCDVEPSVYILNGEEVSHDFLCEKYGKAMAGVAIELAME